MLSKQPVIEFVFDRRKRSSLLHKAVIELRITYDYRQKYVSTGIFLYSNQWKQGRVVNAPEALQLNQTLDTILINVRQMLMEMSLSGNIDINKIADSLRQKDSTQINFISFCNQRAKVRKYEKRHDSQERYNRFIRLFTKWGKIRNFEDITEKNIIEYDEYLKNQGMQNYSKWNNYHRFLNGFILDAIEEGHLHRNPYKWVKIRKDKSDGGIGKYLSPEEFERVKTSKMPTESLERVRDLFIFQTYTCLSYTDLRDFKVDEITELKGMKIYTGKRQKTGKPFTIPLFDIALDILQKYNNKLPMLSNVKYNEYLKAVAQFSGIDRPLSSHWARHTGATLLLNEGINMNIVSKICGHSSIRITEQIYAKLLDETVVEAVQMFNNK